MVNDSRLVQSQGPQPGQTFMLDQDLLIIGRDPHNNIVINDPQISRQHARIMRQGDLMVVEDAGSTNGTFVNGMRLTGPHALANGDVVGLGDVVTLTYYGASAATTEPLVEEPTAAMGQMSYEPPPPPTPAYTAAPPPTYMAEPPPVAQPVEEKKRKTGLWIGCGCLTLLVIGACIGVFVLDYLGQLPPIFYTPLQWLGLI
ncbi:MAG: FHA domain-containing protein [Chloroflexi bacterium]|nr:FHA domain-containing protein [Chloroflexota bacterium]